METGNESVFVSCHLCLDYPSSSVLSRVGHNRLVEVAKTKTIDNSPGKPLRKKKSPPLNALLLTLPPTRLPTLYRSGEPPRACGGAPTHSPGNDQSAPRPSRPEGEKLASVAPGRLPYTAPPEWPTLHLPTDLPYTYPAPRSQVARPAAPSRPTLHPPPPASRQPPRGRRTTQRQSLLVSRPTYPTPRPGHDRSQVPSLPTDLPCTAPRPRENDQVAIPQPHPRVLPVRLASCVAGGLSLGNLGEEGLTLSRS